VKNKLAISLVVSLGKAPSTSDVARPLSYKTIYFFKTNSAF